MSVSFNRNCFSICIYSEYPLCQSWSPCINRSFDFERQTTCAISSTNCASLCLAIGSNRANPNFQELLVVHKSSVLFNKTVWLGCVALVCILHSFLLTWVRMVYSQWPNLSAEVFLHDEHFSVVYYHSYQDTTFLSLLSIPSDNTSFSIELFVSIGRFNW